MAILTAQTTSCFILTAIIVFVQPMPLTEYMRLRSEVISREESRRLGSSLVLSSQEKTVNNYLMKSKRNLIDGSRQNQSVFFPAKSFHLTQPMIDKTDVFKIIHRMPKGGALHLHDQSMVSLDWIVKNVTYRDEMYMCVKQDGYLYFRALNNASSNADCLWKSVKEEREAASSVDDFDLHLYRNMTMVNTDPVQTYSDNPTAWVRFSTYFAQIDGLISYLPVYRDIYWRTMQEFRDANVQYIEVRTMFYKFYDLTDRIYTSEDAILAIRQVRDDFIQLYPDFSGINIILAGVRNSNVSDVMEEVKTAMHLHTLYPDIVAGYDMIGNEAGYFPLQHYIEALLYPSQQDPPYNLPFFFHAGETNFHGTSTDQNLVDALLLNTTRIGHGFVLNKHPELLKMVKEKNVPIEVQPISNQVLRLVSDFRDHPMASLMADGYPVVISSDDKALWNAEPQSHDLYVTFMAMSSEEADLTFLKQLVINSILYSALSSTKRDTALVQLKSKWDKFITDTLLELNLSQSSNLIVG